MDGTNHFGEQNLSVFDAFRTKSRLVSCTYYQNASACWFLPLFSHDAHDLDNVITGFLLKHHLYFHHKGVEDSKLHFTTLEPPKYSNSNSPNLCFCLLKGDKKTFSLVQKIFSTNKNVFLSPFNKQKQRFGELEFKYFGGSDVANKLYNAYIIFQNLNKQKREFHSGLTLYVWWKI